MTADDDDLPAEFDREFYLEANPDVAAAGQDPALHYLNHGRREGRVYSRSAVREIRYSSTHRAFARDEPIADIDRDQDFTKIFARARQYTMTPKARVYALVDACRYVERAGIAGDFVECGVWRGGSSIAAALAFERFGGATHGRRIFLYDTFEGMVAPTAIDVDSSGIAAQTYIDKYADDGRWVYASEKEVRSNLESAGVTTSECVFVVGDVLQTIPRICPESIAICRLDTDWYASTAHELSHLYPRLAPGGVLMVDDYGDWNGSRVAVDEFLAHHPDLFLTRVDSSARLIVKPRR